MQAIINTDIYDFDEYRTGQYVIFDNRIVETGPMAGFDPARKIHKIEDISITDGRGALMLPGLAICHTHIYSTFSRGLALPFDPHNFVELLEQLWWKLDSGLNRELTFSSAQVSALGYQRHGVSAIIDHHASSAEILGTLDSLKKAVVDEAGIHGMFCFETSDRFDVQACIDENAGFLKTAATGAADESGASNTAAWGAHFGLHASFTLSDETLGKVREAADGAPIHIHVAESEEDQIHCEKTHGKRVVERLKDFGLLTHGSLLVHAAYLSETELDIIGESGVHVVVNPTSNMNNGVGLPDVKAMLDRGIPVLLGNDGMSTSIADEWRNLMFPMHHRYQDPVALGTGELLKIINNGYDYLNGRLGRSMGHIKAGFEADFMLLDYNAPTPMNNSNAMGHLVFGMAHALRPRDFWTGGQRRLNAYELTADEAAVHARSRELSAALWEKLAKL